MKTVAFATGIIATLIGFLWIGQGAGWINWPASSFMINQKDWVFYGACVAVVGLFLIGFARMRS